MDLMLEGGDDREHKYGWVAARFSQSISDQIIQISDTIDVDDIYDMEGFGLEDNPHVTILYGILDGQQSAVDEIMEGQREFNIKLARLNVFKNDKYDVLHIEVDSKELMALNSELVKGLSHENDYPDYKPHVTVAYLRKGQGDKYIDPFTFRPLTETVSSVFYQNSDKSVRIDYDLNKDRSLPRKVRFKDIGTAQMWVDKLPEKYRDKIVPFYYESGGFYGVSLVSDTPLSMERHKGVFMAHVEKTGLRPMFCYLNRPDSMHMLKDPEKAATNAGPENEVGSQAELEINPEDLETADQESEDISDDEMQEFEDLLGEI